MLTREEIRDKVDFNSVDKTIQDHMVNYAYDKINKRKCKVRGVMASMRDVIRFADWMKKQVKRKYISMRNINHVKNNTVREYIDYLIENYSNKSISVYMTNLKGFMTYLHNRDYIEVNNFGMNLELPAESKTKVFYKPEDGAKIVEASKHIDIGSPLMNYAMLKLAEDAGFRKFEIVKAKLSDYIDYRDQGVIRVEGKGSSEIGKVAMIPLLDSLREALDEYLESNEFIQGSEFLFPSNYFGKKHVSESHLDNVFKASKKLARVENFTIHKWRRCLTTRMMRAELPLEDMQHMLRHSSKQVTEMVYKQVAEIDQIQKLGERMKNI